MAKMMMTRASSFMPALAGTLSAVTARCSALVYLMQRTVCERRATMKSMAAIARKCRYLCTNKLARCTTHSTSNASCTALMPGTCGPPVIGHGQSMLVVSTLKGMRQENFIEVLVMTTAVIQSTPTLHADHAYFKDLDKLNMCATLSSGVPTSTPWPRFRMCPFRPAFARQSFTAASMASGDANSTAGSTLPCNQRDLVTPLHTTSPSGGTPIRTAPFVNADGHRWAFCRIMSPSSSVNL